MCTESEKISNLRENLIHLIFKRAITIEEDPEVHKNIFLRGFIAAFIYSIAYGFYEYFVVYNYIKLGDIFGTPVINWIIMYVGVLLVVGLATKFKIEHMIFGLFFMAMLEDVVFWMCLWADKGAYPYPAGNWWDDMIASFRVLGGLGWPIPFWPYFPFYYIPGFIIVIGYYISCIQGPRSSRIYAWIIGPFFIAIIVGALSTDLFALISLISIPTISYIYILTLFYLDKKERE